MSIRDDLLELLSYLPRHREIDDDDLAEVADEIVARFHLTPRAGGAPITQP